MAASDLHLDYLREKAAKLTRAIGDLERMVATPHVQSTDVAATVRYIGELGYAIQRESQVQARRASE